MIFFLHKKNVNLNPFVINLPHNAHMVDLSIRKKTFNKYNKLRNKSEALCKEKLKIMILL